MSKISPGTENTTNSYKVTIYKSASQKKCEKVSEKILKEAAEKAAKKQFPIKSKYSLFDIDRDGDIDFNDLTTGIKRPLKYLSYLYDVSLDNLPFGSILGLTFTVIATTIISSGIGSCGNILSKYSSRIDTLTNYYAIGLAFFILVDVIVLLHGLSVCTLETYRECYDPNKAKPYQPKPKNKCCRKCCRKFRNCSSIGCQTFWGIMGTILIWLLYFVAIGMTILSSLGTISSYLFIKTCNIFSAIVFSYKTKAQNYLNIAKEQLKSIDQTTVNILYQYNEFINLQESFKNSGIGQISQITDPTFVDIDNSSFLVMPSPPPENKMYIEKEMYNGRHLSEQQIFNPQVEIAKGRSVYKVLNQSILETEAQLNYYTNQANLIETACYDYSGIYDSLYLISIGVILLMIGRYIIFATHYKYFSVWNYELRLLKNKDYK